MPIYITVDHEDPDAEYELLQLLCKDEWEIAPQMFALEKWLLVHKEMTQTRGICMLTFVSP